MASAGVPPPDGPTPAALFLRVSEWPSPRAPLDFRFSVAPDVALYARGMTGADLVRMVTERRPAVMAAATVTDEQGVRIFRDADHVGAILEAGELDALCGEVALKLDTFCPMYGRSDVARWTQVLTQGAKDVPSVGLAMAGCYDLSLGFGGACRKPRPDLYYGAPIRELLDGHHMAFQAAFDFYHRDR